MDPMMLGDYFHPSESDASNSDRELKDPVVQIAKEIMHINQAHTATTEYFRNHYKEMSFEKVMFFAKQLINLENMQDEFYHGLLHLNGE